MLQKLVSSFPGCSASTRLTIFSSLGHNYDIYKAHNNYNVDNLVCTLGLFCVKFHMTRSTLLSKSFMSNPSLVFVTTRF